MTSEAQVKANRANAKRATGPKSQSGKARAAGNARRHGLTAAVIEGSPEACAIELLARAFLGDMPRRDISCALALEAATAQRKRGQPRVQPCRHFCFSREFNPARSCRDRSSWPIAAR